MNPTRGPLFGHVTIASGLPDRALLGKLREACELLERASPRLSERQAEVFTRLAKIEVVGSVRPQARAGRHDGTIQLSAAALKRHRLGGLVWLICHEAWHVGGDDGWKSQGNANLFANRIKALIGKEPALHRWGRSA